MDNLELGPTVNIGPNDATEWVESRPHGDRICLLENIEYTLDPPTIRFSTYPTFAALEADEVERIQEHQSPNEELGLPIERVVSVERDAEPFIGEEWPDMWEYLTAKGIPESVVKSRRLFMAYADPVEVEEHDGLRAIAFHCYRIHKRDPARIGSTATKWNSRIHFSLNASPADIVRMDRTNNTKVTWGTVATYQIITLIEIPGLLFISTLRPFDWFNQHYGDTTHTFSQHFTEDNELIHQYNLGAILVVKVALFHNVMRDEHSVLRQIKHTLARIDGDIPSDSLVRKQTSYWRNMLSTWRTHLNSRYDFFKDVRTLIDQLLVGHADKDVPQGYLEDLVSHCDTIESLRVKVLANCESTFNGLMATMSIMSSERAIQEAEEVTKLTHLAVFFIPLTFVAGIFGMNFEVWAENGHGPTVWMWIICSVGLLSVTYLVLFYAAVQRMIRDSWSRTASPIHIWEDEGPRSFKKEISQSILRMEESEDARRRRIKQAEKRMQKITKGDGRLKKFIKRNLTYRHG